MRKFFLHIIVALICAACSQMPENAVHVDDLPDIFPDYKDVTIPKEIAPLNFMLMIRRIASMWRRLANRAIKSLRQAVMRILMLMIGIN